MEEQQHQGREQSNGNNGSEREEEIRTSRAKRKHEMGEVCAKFFEDGWHLLVNSPHSCERISPNIYTLLHRRLFDDEVDSYFHVMSPPIINHVLVSIHFYII
jgi:hypothetical protein